MNTSSHNTEHRETAADFTRAIREAFSLFSEVISEQTAELRPREKGLVTEVQRGIAEASALARRTVAVAVAADVCHRAAAVAVAADPTVPVRFAVSGMRRIE